MAEFSKDATFWYARLVQALFIFAGCLVFMPPLWAFIYLNITGVFSGFELSFSQILALTLIPYPKSLLTALFIGLVLAFRSGTWGSISLLFAILTSFICAFIIMIITAVLQYFWPQWMNDTGFGGEFNFGWLVAFAASGALYYWLLVLSGFYDRYQIDERPNLIAAFWAALTYGISTPVLYLLITVKLAFGSAIAAIASGPIKQVQVETTAYLIAALLAFAIASLMRRFGRLTPLAILVLPWVVCAVLLLLRLIALPSEVRGDLSSFYIWVFIWLAFLTGILSLVVFYLLGIIGKRQGDGLGRNIALYEGQSILGSVIAASFIFAVMTLVAPIILHFTNQSLLAIFIGYPPIGYLWRNIWIAYVQAGCIFGGLLAISVFMTGRLKFSVFLGWAIIACLLGSLLPMRPFILSFGFFIDNIAWPMLSYLCVIILCWVMMIGLERFGVLAQLRNYLKKV
ncbi:hypothetical protein [Bartonella sp. HY038]|uniref:hypothetical protein n=1 Tax=Bartonella sp. HY038 TaxID=2759660 RepID=UPI0015FDA42F|nr:hypothetical protein [Bartonella sp. HY038]